MTPVKNATQFWKTTHDHKTHSKVMNIDVVLCCSSFCSLLLFFFSFLFSVATRRLTDELGFRAAHPETKKARRPKLRKSMLDALAFGPSGYSCLIICRPCPLPMLQPPLPPPPQPQPLMWYHRRSMHEAGSICM